MYFIDKSEIMEHNISNIILWLADLVEVALVLITETTVVEPVPAEDTLQLEGKVHQASALDLTGL